MSEFNQEVINDVFITNDMAEEAFTKDGGDADFNPTHQPKKPLHKRIRWWGWTLIGFLTFIIVFVITFVIVWALLRPDPFVPVSRYVNYHRSFMQPVPDSMGTAQLNFRDRAGNLLTRELMEERIADLVYAAHYSDDYGIDELSIARTIEAGNIRDPQAFLDLMWYIQEITAAPLYRGHMIATTSAINVYLLTDAGPFGILQAGSNIEIAQFSSYSRVNIHGQGEFSQIVSGMSNLNTPLSDDVNAFIEGFANVRTRNLHLDTTPNSQNIQQHRFSVDLTSISGFGADFGRLDQWASASYSNFDSVPITHIAYTGEPTIPPGPPEFLPLFHHLAVLHGIVPSENALRDSRGYLLDLTLAQRQQVSRLIAGVDPHLYFDANLSAPYDIIINPNSRAGADGTGFVYVNPAQLNNLFGFNMAAVWATLAAGTPELMGGTNTGLRFPEIFTFTRANETVSNSYYYIEGLRDSDMFMKRLKMGWHFYNHGAYMTVATRGGRNDQITSWFYTTASGVEGDVRICDTYITPSLMWDSHLFTYHTFLRTLGRYRTAGTTVRPANPSERGGRIFPEVPLGRCYRNYGITHSGHIFNMDTIDWTKTSIVRSRSTGPDLYGFEQELLRLSEISGGAADIESLRREFTFDPFYYWSVDLHFNQDYDVIRLATRYSAELMLRSVNDLIRPYMFYFSNLDFTIEFFDTGHIRRFLRAETFHTHSHMMSPIGQAGAHSERGRGRSDATNPSVNSIDEVFGYNVWAMTRGMGLAYFLRAEFWPGTSDMTGWRNNMLNNNASDFPGLPPAIINSLRADPIMP